MGNEGYAEQDYGPPPKESFGVESSTSQDKSYLKYAIDGREIIDQLQTTMLGLAFYHQKDGSKKTIQSVRKYKPLFTDEYTHGLIQNLTFFANPVLSTTEFKDEAINTKMMNFITSLKEDLLTHGDDHYISSNSWKLILMIHEAKYVTKKNGKEVVNSGWLRHGIRWNYDDPVTEDMLRLVKDYGEECDQGIIFKRIMTEISPFVHACMNKSSNHLMLRYIGETHRISHTNTVDQQAAKRGIGGFFGGGSGTNNQQQEQRF